MVSVGVWESVQTMMHDAMDGPRSMDQMQIKVLRCVPEGPFDGPKRRSERIHSGVHYGMSYVLMLSPDFGSRQLKSQAHLSQITHMEDLTSVRCSIATACS